MHYSHIRCNELIHGPHSLCVITFHLPSTLYVLGVANFELLPIVGSITVVLILALSIKDKLLCLLYVLDMSWLQPKVSDCIELFCFLGAHVN